MCRSLYASKAALRTHAKKHVKSYEDMKLLEKGYQPEETKVGTKFRGKNRVIIS